MKSIKNLCRPFCMLLFFLSVLTLSTAIAKTLILPLLGPGEKREVGPFNSIEISGAFQVTLVQGASETVYVDASPDLASKVITKVESGELKIYTDKHFKSEKTIALIINFKDIKEIDCSGAINLTASGPLKLNDFSFDASGACKADLDVSAGKLEVDISGAGNLVLKGTASQVDLDISGAGKYLASELAADDYNVDISGTGNAEVNAVKTLNVEVSGSGKVKYKGEPKLHKEISGVANVTKL